jgi:hypothetical protein
VAVHGGDDDDMMLGSPHRDSDAYAAGANKQEEMIDPGAKPGEGVK